MKTKFIEIRDRLTCIPALAVKMENEEEIGSRAWGVARSFLGHTGYPSDGSTVILAKIGEVEAKSDPYAWGDRTMGSAHVYVSEHFDDLDDGQVVDVRVVLGEATTTAPAEIAK